MKEFSAQTGGRYTYVDDIANLQDLALAFASIFVGCDNFIISGCEISGTSISPGYIYINGKIRYFSGISGITKWPQFLYESNKTETVAYASGSDKVGRNIYGCALAETVPTTLDPLTNAIPAYIKLTADGGLTMRDALFGRYALLLKSSAGKQVVDDVVTFNNDININGVLSTKNRAKLTSGNATCQIYYSGENLVVQSQIDTGSIYRFTIANGKGFQFYVNDTLVYKVDENGINTELPITVQECIAGNISIESSNIINKGHASDSACININMSGYNGGSTHYRNTYIGNGKGIAILSIIGSNNTVNINGQLGIKSTAIAAITLQSTASKDNLALRKIIEWKDVNGIQIANIGYNSLENNVFEIKNSIANISIIGYEAVDIGPAIKENGQLLSVKYVTATKLNQLLEDKANTSAVYTQTQANDKFASKNGGLSQFAGTYTKAQLRQQIEAVSASDVSNSYPAISKLLSDMATTEDKKSQICKNIGAAREGSFQTKLLDTGWVNITGSLYARQIGNVVCIQGTVRTIHSGTVFTLPNSIDAPKYDVAFSTSTSYNSPWTCKISGGQKKCNMIYCNGACGKTISISMTYMV